MKNILSLSLLIVLMVGCKNKNNDTTGEASDEKINTEKSISERIAYANGFENYDNVKEFDFTFNVKMNDTLRAERSWKWWPKENKVQLIEKEDTLSYNRNDQMDDKTMTADKKFVNDSYWLLFPYQLMWSKYDVKENPSQKAPISGKDMTELTVMYSDKGGYTPGDTYHLYLDDNDMIKEWTYQSSKGNTITTTWEDYSKYDGISLSKMHNNKDGSFQLYFTNVDVKE